MSGARPIRLAVLASGGGRTFENLVQLSREGALHASVELLVTSTRNAGALERAARLRVPSEVIRPRDFADVAEFGRALWARIATARVDLVVLAGYLARLPMDDAWRHRVMNIHPALLPAFGGAGFYGHHVHEAVLAAGAKESGCTVHFVDDEYDHGPIILQRRVPVLPGDTADTLAARVFEAECAAYPQAIRWFAEGRLAVEGGRVVVRPA